MIKSVGGIIFIKNKYLLQLRENKKIAWCGCKRSSKGAFCDGAHNKL